MSLNEQEHVSVSGGQSESQNEFALLSWIQQFAPYGVITLDKSFRIQIWNNWMEVHSSMRSEDMQGKDFLTLFPELQERKLVSHLERALAGEASVLSTSLHHFLLSLPSPLRENPNATMLQTARIAPLLANQKVCGIVIVIEDVTQRERQAEILRRQHRRDEILSWALGHFLKTEEPRKTVRQLFFKIAEYLDFDTFFLYLRDSDSGHLVLHTTGGVPESLEKEFVDYPLLARAAQAPEILILNSLKEHADPEFSILKKVGVSAAIAIPLFANDRSLGLLCFGTWNRETIATDEADLLTTIAQYLATAVDRENTNHQLKKAREQLSNHAQLLEVKVRERTSRLEETISELETFSYTLAHDLKAPVRGMIGYCNVLAEDFGAMLPPGANLILQKMARTPRRMEALIKDLLQFSEISRQEIELSKVEIESVIEDVLSMRLPSVREVTHVQMPLLAVRAHKTLLQRVLANLVDNAIKFVEPETKPRITISTELVLHTSPSTRSGALLFNSLASTQLQNPDAGSQTKPDVIRIWVRDEGIGIPAEAHQKIFGIFERGAFASRYEGTGMGLAIVARAVQRMGGTCGVESEPGKGSRFWVELPAA